MRIDGEDELAGTAVLGGCHEEIFSGRHDTGVYILH
jgi:hypothetical protein